jgi:triosephosphate isomerase
MSAVVAGNWKMNLGPTETQAFFEAFRPAIDPRGPEVLIFPPAVSLVPAARALGKGSPISLGVQNIHWEESGALTGETSAGMAIDAGATYALVGHSERRHVFGETNDETGLKVARALSADLIPVLCVGETLEQRRSGDLERVLLEQLDAGVAPVAAAPAAPLIVAYEPVWAIGTGETATPADAAAAHAILHDRLAALLGAARCASVPILYGGSVKPSNAAELMAAERVDGVLVGGASLDPDSFTQIIAAAPREG